MSIQVILSGLTLFYLIFGGIVSYWVNSMLTNIKDLSKSISETEKELQKLQVLIPSEYIKRQEVILMLDKLEKKIDK